MRPVPPHTREREGGVERSGREQRGTTGAVDGRDKYFITWSVRFDVSESFFAFADAQSGSTSVSGPCRQEKVQR